MPVRDTIFALSSGVGRQAVAVIRISGPASARVIEEVTGGLPEPRRLSLRTISNPVTGEALDIGCVVWLPGPGTFTGEDCAELHIHGGPAVISGVLDVLVSMPGTRSAEAGEFTRRAFVNGKMDLVEVEGLSDLLAARTSGQRRQAFRQMSGLASSVFEGWREKLLSIRADIEAVIDFADETDIEAAASCRIDSAIGELIGEMGEVLRTSAASEMVRDGVRVVLAGMPNTGKSSLLNLLAGREAAIVSALPGTTRDSIEVVLDLAGIPVILTDTAGLREGADEIEQEGIRRSRSNISGADILVWVWSADVNESWCVETGIFPDLVVQNKIDLPISGLVEKGAAIALSTARGDGLGDFLAALGEVLRTRSGEMESALVISSRQKQAVVNSIRFLNDTLRVDQQELEIKALEIGRASDEIGRLTGRIGVEEWLGAIFSRFCIGK